MEFPHPTALQHPHQRQLHLELDRKTVLDSSTVPLMTSAFTTAPCLPMKWPNYIRLNPASARRTPPRPRQLSPMDLWSQRPSPTMVAATPMPPLDRKSTRLN